MTRSRCQTPPEPPAVRRQVPTRLRATPDPGRVLAPRTRSRRAASTGFPPIGNADSSGMTPTMVPVSPRAARHALSPPDVRPTASSRGGVRARRTAGHLGATRPHPRAQAPLAGKGRRSTRDRRGGLDLGGVDGLPTWSPRLGSVGPTGTRRCPRRFEVLPGQSEHRRQGRARTPGPVRSAVFSPTMRSPIRERERRIGHTSQ